jgi:hypothetical protein
MVRLYLEDGRSVGVTGEEGVVSLDGKELRGVDVNGGIEVTLADYVVRTDSAHYDRGRDLITADGGVEISGGDLDARGTGMQVEVGARPGCGRHAGGARAGAGGAGEHGGGFESAGA